MLVVGWMMAGLGYLLLAKISSYGQQEQHFYNHQYLYRFRWVS
jgi:hypothetical protein